MHLTERGTYFEKGYQLYDEGNRFYNFRDVGWAALHAGEYERAEHVARWLLGVKAPDWDTGNKQHFGHIILGTISLRRGDVEAAKQELILAGKAPGSPQRIDGGNMFLAKELLEKGEKEAVLRYLQLCGWGLFGYFRCRGWKKAIKRDEIPDFGDNLIR